MSFYDFYHKFFGGRKGDGNRFADNNEEKENDNIGKNYQGDSRRNDMGDQFFDFKVTSDPFAMHHFFEKKINEMMESFFIPDLFPGFDNFPNIPTIEENKNPRDLYLKPEFSQTKPENRNKLGEDGNKEEDSAWLNRLLPAPSQPEASVQPRAFSSFKSVIRKSVTLPDGTIKTEEIIRNSDGTEQITESQTLPNGSNPPQFDFPRIDPNFPGFFNFIDVPQTKIKSDFDLLKPGFESINPHGEKTDKDLDKEIVSSGIGNLPSILKSYEGPESKQGVAVKTFTRRIVTLPNGVVESEEIVHNPDGTEQIIVTQTVPDQTLLKPGFNNDQGSNMGSSFALKGVKDLIDILFK